MNNFKFTKTHILFYALFLNFSFSFISILSFIFIFNKKVTIYFLEIPLFILIEYFVISLLILCGLMLNDLKIKLNQVFVSTLLATTIYLIQYILEFIWVLIFKNTYEPNYLRNFSSFSLYHFYHPLDIPSYLIYPLQTINLWDIIYITVVIHFIKRISGRTDKEIAKTVSITYIIGLVSWVIFATFINIINQGI